MCEWVQEKGFKIEDLGDAVTDYANVEVAPEILVANKMRLTEIVRTVHNVEGQPYIPGSSIKGALRTGLLFSLLLQEDRLRNAAWAEVSRIINDNLMTTGCVIKILPLPGLRRNWKLCCCTV